MEGTEAGGQPTMRRLPLGIVLVSTMVASTFTLFALAVLASPIIDDLGVSRATIGLIGSVNTGLGALTAPWTGRVTDRIGPRRAVLGLLGLSAVAALVTVVQAFTWGGVMQIVAALAATIYAATKLRG